MSSLVHIRKSKSNLRDNFRRTIGQIDFGELKSPPLMCGIPSGVLKPIIESAIGLNSIYPLKSRKYSCSMDRISICLARLVFEMKITINIERTPPIPTLIFGLF